MARADRRSAQRATAGCCSTQVRRRNRGHHVLPAASPAREVDVPLPRPRVRARLRRSSASAQAASGSATSSEDAPVPAASRRSPTPRSACSTTRRTPQAFKDLATAHQADGDIDDADRGAEELHRAAPEGRRRAARARGAATSQQAIDAQERAQIYQYRSAYLAPGRHPGHDLPARRQPARPRPDHERREHALRERDRRSVVRSAGGVGTGRRARTGRSPRSSPNDPTVQLELAQAARVGQRHARP